MTFRVWCLYSYLVYGCTPQDSFAGSIAHLPAGLGLHCKKRFTSFPSPAGMSLTKLPLGRNNSVMTLLFPPREILVVTSRLGTGNSRTFFLRCTNVMLWTFIQLLKLDIGNLLAKLTIGMMILSSYPAGFYFHVGHITTSYHAISPKTTPDMGRQSH